MYARNTTGREVTSKLGGTELKRAGNRGADIRRRPRDVVPSDRTRKLSYVLCSDTAGVRSDSVVTVYGEVQRRGWMGQLRL